MASTGLCSRTLGIQGMAPSTSSSMLGCVAAVMAMVSPSQLNPAVSQRMSISSMGVAVCTVCYRAYCIQSPIETIPVEVHLMNG